jgi:hypothetical protein
VVNGTPWQQHEDDLLRAQYTAMPAPVLAKQLGRTASMVRSRAYVLGLVKPHHDIAAIKALICELNPQGYSDTDIAAQYTRQHGRHVTRETIRDHRQGLGLPNNAFNERHRAKTKEATQRQLDRAGLKSIGMLRSRAFARFAARNGWPADLRPRAVQILNLLYEQGPKTRREIAEAIGMPWKGSRKSLVSNDPEGSYLAHLIARGLVIQLGRIVKGKGRGKSVHKYALPPHITRKVAQ